MGLLVSLGGVRQPLADIYGFVDARGVIHLTDRYQDSRYRRVVRSALSRPDALPSRAALPATTVTLRPEMVQRLWRPSLSSPPQFRDTIAQAAQRYGVDAALLHAVIEVESNFNPSVVSHKGAAGLMQLMPATALRYGVTDRHNPEANIFAGTQHLSYLMQLFKHDLILSLAAYNAGEESVRKYGYQIPPYQETQQYVVKVLESYRRYKQHFTM
ncbi:MAG: lytic transglycosylase domain-containing protein [Magnetococcales bacterium]|nr:lytic transglycosylase domain-containing protein [Magnetococcales bacterium]